MTIDSFLDPEKSNILFLNNNLIEENNDIIDKLNNEKFNLKCYLHGNKHKFRFYCIECLQNICKECCQEHLDGSHNLITFDFENFETMKKVIEIQKILNIYNKKINDNLLNDNNIKGYILEKNHENFFVKKPNNYLENFIKLCNIIILDYSKYPNYSHFYNIENIYRFLIKQIKNSTCKIINGENIETSFFCEQSYGYEKNNFHFLVTTSHIIGKDNNNIKIQLQNNKELFKISIDYSERKTYNNKDDDIFFLEIKNEDFLASKINNYLSIDENININIIDENNKQIFLLCNNENEVKLNTGKIYSHKGKNLEHNCPSNGTTSIGGALLSKDYKVIGINKGKKHKDNYNFIGLFLKEYFDLFNPIKNENNSLLNKIFFEDKYEIIGEIGNGEYGHVYKGINKVTNELVIIMQIYF